MPRDTWTTVNVRLLPAHDATGRVDVWLNGRACGSYSGPMGDTEHGARRNGTPFINAQPRFGIYRDWRADTQDHLLRQDHVLDDPTGHPDMGGRTMALEGASPSPGVSSWRHGSAAGFAWPFCRSSIEMLSGLRTKAMRPSRGGRLMVTPAFISFSQVA